ncbi:hypothetical protein NA57DRAFT_49117 [Rhizodiscina lignyota]|uniref:Uncharacterized protein n=1 Tax=Rhizodiscina lignyota TaxID=1504668 RepID=A0A9P4I4F4_9PEZI|nr:hypothetical protein NA57DRAFT_49117 [Rhizodiscina lignyota]
MPIRNPFKKTPGGVEIVDENARNAAGADFQQTKVVAAKPIDIPETAEYKLCEINGSGVYLPPSPPESKRSFWQSRSNTSTTSSSKDRAHLSDNEPFNISRESFDSYRRSFDISARSPMPDFDARARQSLDSRRAMYTREPRSSFNRHSIDRPDAPVDEGFEEVGLNEETKPKKRGLFGLGSQQPPTSNPDGNKSSTGSKLFPGRKRGQSGQGSELGQMNRPRSAQTVETKE